MTVAQSPGWIRAVTSTRIGAPPLSPSAGWEGRSLTPATRAWLVIEILAAYASVRWRLRGAHLPSLVEAQRGGHELGADPSESEMSLQHVLSLRLGWAVHKLLRRVPSDGACLARSLVLTKLLARRQMPSRLIIGVRSEPSFAAHAWVEQSGRPVLPTDETYRRLVEL